MKFMRPIENMERKIKPDKIKISNRTLWVSGGLVCLIGGIMAAYFLMKKKKKQALIAKINLSSGIRSSRFTCINKDYPLSFGTCHKDVAILQKHLKSLGVNLGTTGKSGDGVDERFGEKTKAAALKKLGKSTFQRRDINALKTL